MRDVLEGMSRVLKVSSADLTLEAEGDCSSAEITGEQLCLFKMPFA